MKNLLILKKTLRQRISINFNKNNQLIENNVGEIKSVDFPISNKNFSGNDYSITFLVKGEKKYADVIVNSYY